MLEIVTVREHRVWLPCRRRPIMLRRVPVGSPIAGSSIGAQVSYPDLGGFGRRFIDIDPTSSPTSCSTSSARSSGFARSRAPRCATSSRTVRCTTRSSTTSDRQAAVVEALIVHAGGLPLMGLPGGVVERLAAERGVAFVAEGFADRGYTADGRLVPRAEPGALLTTPDEVAAQACRLADGGVRSICVHSDTPGASVLAAAVRDALAGAGHPIAAFA
jgi:UPF0271 protein